MQEDTASRAALAGGAVATGVESLVVTVLAIDAVVFGVLLVRAGLRSPGRSADAAAVSAPRRAS